MPPVDLTQITPEEDLGPRRSALRKKRQRKIAQQVLALGVSLVLLFGIISTAVRTVSDSGNGGAGNNGGANGSGKGDGITTTLVIGTKEQTSVAAWFGLMSIDERRDKGSFTYLHSHIASEVPGRGLAPLQDAYASGRVPLLLVTAENLLNIEIDRYLELSDSDARVLFTNTGPLSVEVPDEVRVGAGRDRARLILTPGRQRLAPAFVVTLLYTIGIDGDDSELGTRHLAFWTSFFDLFEQDPDALSDAIESSGAALGESDASLKEHARFFSFLASIDAADREISVLPVQQVSVGDDELYEVDVAEVSEFMAEAVGGHSIGGDQIRVQILNGNGIPGIGQRVAEKLVGEGFRVILSGNARRLNYRKTLIVTYDRSAAGQALADRARRILGVGEVQVAAQQQGIVDLTIVVGKDFVP